MKKIAIVVFLVISTGAKSQNTAQAWEFRRSQCQNMANLAAIYYKARIDSPSFISILRPTKGEAGMMNVMATWAFDFATTQALDREQAMSVTFAKCLDNIDRIYRDNGETPISQLK